MSHQFSLDYLNKKISYTIFRSKRKSIQISINKDLSIKVYAPVELSDDLVRSFIYEKASWVIKKLSTLEIANKNKKIIEYKIGGKQLYLGHEYTVAFNKDVREHVELENSQITINTYRKLKENQIQDILEQWFQDQAQIVFYERLQLCLKLFADQNFYTPNKVVIRKLKRVWGSMNLNKKLTLNIDLIKVPIEYLDYVIIHELCHIKHMNHSKEFYQLQESILPNWRELKKELNRCL